MRTRAARQDRTTPLEFAGGEGERDLARLAMACPRLALLVETSSVRSDVRRMRARILIVLRALECPLDATPLRPWYVPGAVARLGLDGIRRAWEHAFDGEVPCERTLRRHLAALEDCFAIVRQPGDRIPSLRRPGRAPRYPDTIHVLEDERDAAWWAGEGAEVLRRIPAARISPERWASLFKFWRGRARSRQLDLFQEPRAPIPMPGCQPVPQVPERAREAALVLAQGLRRGVPELVLALSQAGVHPPSRVLPAILRNVPALRRAAALFALALSRGDRIRDGWAWVRAAMRRASPHEGERALERLGAEKRLGRDPCALVVPFDHGDEVRLLAADRVPLPTGGPPAGSRPRGSVLGGGA